MCTLTLRSGQSARPKSVGGRRGLRHRIGRVGRGVGVQVCVCVNDGGGGGRRGDGVDVGGRRFRLRRRSGRLRRRRRRRLVGRRRRRHRFAFPARRRRLAGRRVVRVFVVRRDGWPSVRVRSLGVFLAATAAAVRFLVPLVRRLLLSALVAAHLRRRPASARLLPLARHRRQQHALTAVQFLLGPVVAALQLLDRYAARVEAERRFVPVVRQVFSPLLHHTLTRICKDFDSPVTRDFPRLQRCRLLSCDWLLRYTLDHTL